MAHHDLAVEKAISKAVMLILSPDMAADVPVNFVATNNACRSFDTMRRDVKTMMNGYRLVSKMVYMRYKVISMEIVGDDNVNAQFTQSPKRLQVKFVYDLKKMDEDSDTVKSTFESEVHTVHIPLMYNYHGKIDSSDVPDCSNMGAIIPQGQRGRVVLKVIINALDDTAGYFPKYSKKNGVDALMVTSKEPAHKSFMSDRKPQFINIALSIARDKTNSDFKFSIKSKMAIPETDIIHLILFLSRWDVESVKREITNGFERDCTILIESIIKISLSAFKEVGGPTFENIRKRIRDDFHVEYLKNSSAKRNVATDGEETKAATSLQTTTFETFFNQTMSDFLPHIESHDDEKKALFLIMTIRELFGHIVVPKAMIDKRNHMSKKFLTPGEQFRYSIEKALKNHVEKIKKNWKEKGSSDLSSVKGTDEPPPIESDITAMLNKRDKSTTQLIRINDITNQVKAVMLPNRVNTNSILRVVRFTKNRNADMFASGFIDKYQTTDSAKYVALTDSTCVGLRVVSETIEEHKNILEKVRAWISAYTGKFEGVKDERLVWINMIDTSFCNYMWQIPQSKVDVFIRDFRRSKRRNEFDSIYVGIAKRGCFGVDRVRGGATADPNVPFDVLVSVSNNQSVQPVLIVEDGKLALADPTILASLNMNNSSLTLFMAENKDVIEFVSSMQKSFSCVVQSFKYFEMLGEAERKLVDFVEIPELCSSWSASTLPDIGHQAAIRIHFSSEKTKHHIGQKPVRNNLESYTSLYVGHRPLITNTANICSEIHAVGCGNYCLTTPMSFGGNIEDGITINKKSALKGMLGVFSVVTKAYDDISGQKMSGPNPQYVTNNYWGVNSRGFREAATIVKKGDAMYRSTNQIFSEVDRMAIHTYDSSAEFEESYVGYVDRVVVSGVQKKRITYNILLVKMLKEGDKISAGAQKKVVVNVLEDHEMPRTEQGVAIDVIFNATCVVDRQTYNLYNYMILTNAAAVYNIGDNNEFKFFNIPTISPDKRPADYVDEARRMVSMKLGPNPPDKYVKGESRLINPMTLEPYTDPQTNEEITFQVAMLHITRAPQIALDKVSTRNRGPYTRYMEPPGGLMGGIKKGYMEVDTEIGYGVANIVNDSLHGLPERRIKVMLCTTCGQAATPHVNDAMKTFRCLICPRQQFVCVERKYVVSVQSAILRQRGIQEVPVVTFEPIMRKPGLQLING